MGLYNTTLSPAEVTALYTAVPIDGFLNVTTTNFTGLAAPSSWLDKFASARDLEASCLATYHKNCLFLSILCRTPATGRSRLPFSHVADCESGLCMHSVTSSIDD